MNDVLYHAPERRPLQDVVTCIREHVTIDKAGRLLEANAERHLKPPAEMARLFRRAPEAIDRTLRFLDRCNFSLDELKKTEYPDENRAGFATPQDALVALAEEGYRRRYPDGASAKVRHALDRELEMTVKLDYAKYFLTVYDIVNFARSKGILCQGRGSAANSVICYCLGITEVDPEKVDLLFERFVSEERQEPPDIDVDFEHERREEVIQHIYDRYGRHHANLTATVICYRGRSAIREVGKAFGLSDDTVGALAGMLWGWSQSGVKEKEARRAGLDPDDPRLNQVMQLAEELIDTPRHLSQHPGGFLITRSRIDEVVPVENAAMDERTVIEWEKNDLETLRLLKVDVLGLGMLSCLRRGLDLLRIHYSARPPIPSLLDASRYKDEEGAQAGLPHDPARRHARRVPDRKPRADVDAAAAAAGASSTISSSRSRSCGRGRSRARWCIPICSGARSLARRRAKSRTIRRPRRSMATRTNCRSILQKTLGIPLFQEQAMRIAIVAAKFTAVEANRLRRAMATFKRVGTIKNFEDKFINGMVGARLRSGIRRELLQPDPRLRRIRLSGKPRGELRQPRLRLVLDEVPLPRRLRRRAAQQPADGLLRAGADRARRARAWRRGAAGRREPVGLGLHAGERCPRQSRRARRCVHAVDERRHPHHPCDAARLPPDQRLFRGRTACASRACAAAASTRCAISGCARGCRPPRWSASPMPMRSARSASTRRDALWAVRALQRAGDKDDLPLFARVAMPELEPDAALPPMPPGEQVVEDYRHLHLSLKAHPVSFLRARSRPRAASRGTSCCRAFAPASA